jgi:choline transport protein
MQKILSYISGWLAALGWQAFIASSAYQTGNVILILASMQNPGYVPTVW